MNLQNPPPRYCAKPLLACGIPYLSNVCLTNSFKEFLLRISSQFKFSLFFPHQNSFQSKQVFSKFAEVSQRKIFFQVQFSSSVSKYSFQFRFESQKRKLKFVWASSQDSISIQIIAKVSKKFCEKNPLASLLSPPFSTNPSFTSKKSYCKLTEAALRSSGLNSTKTFTAHQN